MQYLRNLLKFKRINNGFSTYRLTPQDQLVLRGQPQSGKTTLLIQSQGNEKILCIEERQTMTNRNVPLGLHFQVGGRRQMYPS